MARTSAPIGNPAIEAKIPIMSKAKPLTIPAHITVRALTRTPATPRTTRPGTDARIITWFVIASTTVASPATHHRIGLAEKPARSITHSDVARRSVWMV